MSITASVVGNLSVTDNSTGAVSLQRALNFQFVGSTFDFASTASIGTSPTSITLPISPVQFAIIWNQSLTGTLTCTWTPNGGASNVVLTLQPGSAIMFCENNTTSGFTALSLQASLVSTPVFYALAG